MFDFKLRDGEKVPYPSCRIGKDIQSRAAQKYQSSERGKKIVSDYKSSDQGKANNRRYDQSQKGKASTKRYNQSEKGKASASKYRSSDSGQARAADREAAVAGRRLASTALRLMDTMASMAYQLANGVHDSSPTFIERSGFVDQASYIAHMQSSRSQVQDPSNESPHIDHKIPKEAYDHSDPDDVKRCWSPCNMHMLSAKDNRSKSWILVEEYILQVPPEFWPKSWNGKIPTQQEREMFYTKCRQGATQPTDM